MKRGLWILPVLVISCSPKAPAPPPPEPEAIELPIPVIQKLPEDQPEITPPKKPAETFKPYIPAAPVQHVLKSSVPALPNPFVASPTARSSAIEQTQWPWAPPQLIPPALPGPSNLPVLPSPPNEGIPFHRDVEREPNWRTRKLTLAPSIPAPARPTLTASDVPALGSQVPDPIAKIDPTEALSTQLIVQMNLTAPPIVVPFIARFLADSNERAEQVRLPSDSEFATSPVFVPPARP